VPLPHHVARKKVPALDARGEPAQVDAAKFETFIFDALPAAKTFLHVECRREEEFAPIKNKTGVDSLETARELVTAEHRRWLAAAGVKTPGPVEVSPLAALDAEDLARRLDRAGPRTFPGGVRVDLDPDGIVRAHAV
jgi:UDP-N-acetylglucosamine pyrophosphorylase